MEQETVSADQLGNYLAILAKHVTFDVDTKRILSKEELNEEVNHQYYKAKAQ